MKTRSKSGSDVLLTAMLCVVATTCSSRRVCDEWQSRVRNLTPSQRAELATYGARAAGGWVLLDADVVADCELRGRFSRYVGSIVRGVAADPDDRAAVRNNGSELVAALARVWPTRGRYHVPGSDGAFRDELSSVLVTADVSTDAMRPLIAKLLREDGVSGEVAYALLTRPDPAIAPELRRLAAAPRSGEEMIRTVAILQRLGDDPVPLLDRPAGRSGLTPAVRDAVHRLIERHRRHEPPTWDDVMDVPGA